VVITVGTGHDLSLLGQIFTKSQNKIIDPAKSYQLIARVNAEQWVLMGVKDKGDIYEGLLDKMQKMQRPARESTLH
jgi:type I restriction enzyme M protein